MEFNMHKNQRLNLPSLRTWRPEPRRLRICLQRVADPAGLEVRVEVLDRRDDCGRFVDNPVLAHLEKCWANPKGFGADSTDVSLEGNSAHPKEGSTARTRRDANSPREMDGAPGGTNFAVSPNDSGGLSFVQLELG